MVYTAEVATERFVIDVWWLVSTTTNLFPSELFLSTNVNLGGFDFTQVIPAARKQQVHRCYRYFKKSKGLSSILLSILSNQLTHNPFDILTLLNHLLWVKICLLLDVFLNEDEVSSLSWKATLPMWAQGSTAECCVGLSRLKLYAVALASCHLKNRLLMLVRSTWFNKGLTSNKLINNTQSNCIYCCMTVNSLSLSVHVSWYWR